MELFNIAGIGRQVVKDHTFSDGTFIKKGSWIAANSYAAHMDEDMYNPSQLYSDSSESESGLEELRLGRPEEFNPWRFSDLRERCELEKRGSGGKHQYVSLNSNYLAFGYGHHAW